MTENTFTTEKSCSNVLEKINLLGEKYVKSGEAEIKKEILLYISALYQEKITESYRIDIVKATEESREKANQRRTEVSNETIWELIKEEYGRLHIKVTIKRKSYMFLGQDLGNMRIDNAQWCSWIDNYKDSCYKKTLIEYFMDQIFQLRDMANAALSIDNKKFNPKLSKNSIYERINEYARMYVEEKQNGATAWTDNAQMVWALSCGLFTYNEVTGKYAYRSIEYEDSYANAESIDPPFEKIRYIIEHYNNVRAKFTSYLFYCLKNDDYDRYDHFISTRRIGDDRDSDKLVQIKSLDGAVSNNNDTIIEEIVPDPNISDPAQSVQHMTSLVNMAKWLSDFSNTLIIKKKAATPEKRKRYCVVFANDFVKNECPMIYTNGLGFMIKDNDRELNEMFGLKYREEEKKRFSICHAYIQYLDISMDFENEEKVIEHFRGLEEYNYIGAYDIYRLWAYTKKLNREKIDEQKYLAQYYNIEDPNITGWLKEYNKIKQMFFL